ncbi:MAG: HAD family phosphatase [bacterium]|nr:HAD family phosphatase [bacterium]
MKEQHTPKLVASDIGGTLIQGGNIMPAFTADALNRLAQTGLPVALITGFNRNTTLKLTANLDDSIYLLPQNGTMCLRGKEIIWEYGVTEKEARLLYTYLTNNDLPVIIYKGTNGRFKNYFKGPADFEISEAFERIDTIDDFTGITGVSTRVPNDLVIETRTGMANIIGDQFQLVYVREEKSSWFEVLQANVRKDLALERLCQTLDVSLQDVIYFGDNFNDLEALRSVGFPILVKNAVPELKEEFPTIIDPVSKEGVAAYLTQLYNLSS